MRFSKIFFVVCATFQTSYFFASSDSEPADFNLGKNSDNSRQLAQTFQSDEEFITVLPKEATNALTFLPIEIKKDKNLDQEISAILQKVSHIYQNEKWSNDEKRDRIWDQVTQLEKKLEDKEGNETLCFDIWTSVCARFLESNKESSYKDDNMFVVGKSFGNSVLRKRSVELFEYNSKKLSEAALYAVGIYLKTIEDYKELDDIRPEQVSCLYRKSLSIFQRKGWPSDNLLSLCFSYAVEDVKTQNNAMKYKPFLFDGF